MKDLLERKKYRSFQDTLDKRRQAAWDESEEVAKRIFQDMKGGINSRIDSDEITVHGKEGDEANIVYNPQTKKMQIRIVKHVQGVKTDAASVDKVLKKYGII